jgi:hypothetical protein
MSLEFKLQNAKKHLTNHVVNATALCAEGLPVYTTMEHLVGFTPEQIIHSRAIGLATMYLGLANVYTAGRNKFFKLTSTTNDSSEKRKVAADSMYGILFNFTTSYPWYWAVGETDIQKITIGAASAAVFGFLNAGAQGFTLDASRELLGLNEQKRVPKSVYNLSRRTKNTILCAGITSSALITYATFVVRDYISK